MPKLRWLTVTVKSEQWDDRDKEFHTSGCTHAPVLQMFDEESQTWENIPSEKKVVWDYEYNGLDLHKDDPRANGYKSMSEYEKEKKHGAKTS